MNTFNIILNQLRYTLILLVFQLKKDLIKQINNIYILEK